MMPGGRHMSIADQIKIGTMLKVSDVYFAHIKIPNDFLSSTRH